MNKKKKIAWGQVTLNLIFIIIALMYIIPFLLTIAISFTDEAVLTASGYSLIPEKFSLAAYQLAFHNMSQLIRSYGVTITFSVVSTILAVLVMGLLAYPLSRPNYCFKGPLSFFVFFTMLFSGGMVPNYLLMTNILHINDTMWVYILPGLVNAYYVMILRTAYRGIPNELVESAKIDGAGELFICFRIMMPLCKASLASIGFLFFVAKWNDWMSTLLYIRDPNLYSLQYLLQRILRETEYLKQLALEGGMGGPVNFPTESYRFAMAILAAGPVLFVFPFFQKYFTKGMTIGGVKG